MKTRLQGALAFVQHEAAGGAALVLAAVGASILTVLNLRGIVGIAPYVVTGVFIWVCVVKSRVHATLAGVVATLSPFRCRRLRAALNRSSS